MTKTCPKCIVQLLIGNINTNKFHEVRTEEFSNPNDLGPFVHNRMRNIGLENLTSPDEFYRINIFHCDGSESLLVQSEIQDKDQNFVIINPTLQGKNCEVHNIPYRSQSNHNGREIIYGICDACADAEEQDFEKEFLDSIERSKDICED